MAKPSPVAALAERMLDLSRTVTAQSIYLLALHAYVREQRAYSPSRFRALLRQEQRRAKAARFQVTGTDADLQAVLAELPIPRQ